MPRLLYSVFFYLLLPLVLLRLLYRALKAPAYRHRILERFGFFSRPAMQGGVWIHAVSVGEVIAAAPMIEHFLSADPAVPVVVTTMTPTGSDRVRALFGERVFHVYAPYDLPGAVRRFLNTLRPAVAVIVETEIWPNLVCQAANRGIPVILANARLSARSARGYQRLSGLTRQVFRRFTWVLAQAEADAARFAELGVSREALQVCGSVKFDVQIPDSIREASRVFRGELGARPVWIAASTHEGEDEIVLAAHRQLLQRHPALLLILVPRHPERFRSVAGLVEKTGFSMCLRSSGNVPQADCEVLLGDTMGELMMLYGCADIAFVGGSLVARGGHNCLEPAAWGLPLVTGESDFNFAEVSELLDAASGRIVVKDATSLQSAVTELLADAEASQRFGHAARSVVEANRGSLQKQLLLIETAMNS